MRQEHTERRLINRHTPQTITISGTELSGETLTLLARYEADLFCRVGADSKWRDPAFSLRTFVDTVLSGESTVVTRTKADIDKFVRSQLARTSNAGIVRIATVRCGKLRDAGFTLAEVMELFLGYDNTLTKAQRSAVAEAIRAAFQ
jgi:hypothetical protein